MAAHLTANPERALIDSDTQITITGLDPRALVLIEARVDAVDGSRWESGAYFLADDTGKIDLAQAVPIEGSYLVADPNGLVWSLALAPGSPSRQRSARFIENDLRAYEIHFRALVDGQEVAAAAVTREPVAAGVIREEVRDDGLVGTLFLPPGVGPHHLIVVVPGSDGGVPEPQAALYASHGFAALALGYFRFGDLLPETLEEIPLEYFGKAFAWAAAHPRLDTSKLIASGPSRGGELSLLLGAWFPETVTAVVSWVPSNYVNGGFAKVGSGLEPKPAWTWRGEPLPSRARPAAPEDAARREGAPHRDGVPVLSLVGLAGAAKAFGNDQDAAAEIAVEKTAGPVALVSGRDDALWPSAFYADWAVDRFRRKDFGHPVWHWSYERAGHSLGPANGPATGVIHNDAQTSGHAVHLGGEPTAIARARADVWPRVLAFIAGHFEGRPLTRLPALGPPAHAPALDHGV
ncbi:MAG: acyl-CoA thioesterase/BAAT N-terminal domain-containing protein [Bifidobacteriaceae bacterium]|nr:acyl-CoA thioesterase/BAAT N-terminal domain-containing protein [Bifidobacteriaceae bacterium]